MKPVVILHILFADLLLSMSLLLITVWTIFSSATELKPENVPVLSKPGAPAALPNDVMEFLQAHPQLLPLSGTSTTTDSSSTSKCECAVFDSADLTANNSPILSHPITNIKCDSAGETSCGKLCAAVAEGAKERGPQWICTVLGHSDPLNVSIHSRICGSTKWTYTGLTSPAAICCHENAVVPCTELVTQPPSNEMPVQI